MIPPLPANIIISQSTTVSTVVSMTGTSPVSLIVPEGLQGTTISFQKSYDGITFYDVRDSQTNGDVTVTIDGSAAAYDLDARYFIGAPYLRVIMQTAQIANQTLYIGVWSL